jgi:hypothetical protein
MPKFSIARSALAAVALMLIAAPAALADTPTVTVRVEGAQSTLLPQTSVTLDSTKPEPVSGCNGTSVAAAINLAVNGNWDHGEANNGGGDFTETILGETHNFSNNSDTWAEWVNYKWGGGICTDLLHDGDQVVMVADNEPPPNYSPTRLPLTASGAPVSVDAGTPFTVNVQEIHTPPNTFANPGDGTPQPAQGATVSGGGASADSDASGNATLTLSTTGNVTLRATKSGDAPSATFSVCVHNGNDGNCGTTASSQSAGAQSSSGASTAGAATLVPAPAPYTGPYAVVAEAVGVVDGHVYRRGHAPRVLGGRVSSRSPIASVSIRLRRSFNGRCQAYSGRTERFFAAPCGQAGYFRLGSGATFSYLLPTPLGPGRYVYDILATDAAGNRVAPARGSSRVVFFVR